MTVRQFLRIYPPTSRLPSSAEIVHNVQSAGLRRSGDACGRDLTSKQIRQMARESTAAYCNGQKQNGRWDYRGRKTRALKYAWRERRGRGQRQRKTPPDTIVKNNIDRTLSVTAYADLHNIDCLPMCVPKLAEMGRCQCTRTRTHKHAPDHTYAPPPTCAHTRTHAQLHAHASKHSSTHTPMRICTLEHKHTSRFSHIDAVTHTHIHAHTRTHCTHAPSMI